MTPTQIIRRGAVALSAILAALALAVPASVAGPQDVLLQSRPQDTSDAFSRYLRNNQPDPTAAVRPDDRAGTRGPGMGVESDAFARYLRNHERHEPTTPSPRPDDRAVRGVGPEAATPAPLTSDGFDWQAAGLAACLAALALVAMAALPRHGYRRVTSS